MTLYSPVYQELNSLIEQLEQSASLYEAERFVPRMQAMDTLEFHLLDAVAQVDDADKLRLLERAEALRRKADEADAMLFTRLLLSVQSNDRECIKRYVEQARQETLTRPDDDYGYDEIDMLVNGLLDVAHAPEEPVASDAEMLFYQPTPARVILKLLDALRPTPDDVFYDLGSGLGHVPILVNLFADIAAKGVELEHAYFQYSTECVQKLNLPRVAFIHADARDADYYDGTIFYMYTPFQGTMLLNVLRRLEARAMTRAIRVCTYGPCTLHVGKQPWLRCVYQTGKREGLLAIFESR